MPGVMRPSVPTDTFDDVSAFLQVLVSASFTVLECLQWARNVGESVLVQAFVVDPIVALVLLSSRLFASWVILRSRRAVSPLKRKRGVGRSAAVLPSFTSKDQPARNKMATNAPARSEPASSIGTASTTDPTPGSSNATKTLVVRKLYRRKRTRNRQARTRKSGSESRRGDRQRRIARQLRKVRAKEGSVAV